MAASDCAFKCTHECAVFTNDAQGATQRSFENCTTNPGHEKFMTIDEFRQKGPSLYPNKEHLAFVWDNIRSTVKVKVWHTSKQRPDTYPGSTIPYPMKEIRGKPYVRNGTGFLIDFVRFYDTYSPDFNIMREVIGLTDLNIDRNVPCLCSDCKSSPQRKKLKKTFSQYFIVVTAAHVLFDTAEAEKAVFEFFYNDEDRKSVQCIYGVRVLDENMEQLKTDTSRILCVAHDRNLATMLYGILKECHEFFVSSSCPYFMVSHPHGVCKRISIGYVRSMKYFARFPRTSPVTLKKGLKFRVSGSQKMVNRLKLIPVDDDGGDGNDDGNRKGGDEFCDGGGGENAQPSAINQSKGRGGKEFRLSSDVTIWSPSGITFATEGEEDILWSGIDVTEQTKWWKLPACALAFVTDSGIFSSSPSRPENVTSHGSCEVLMEGDFLESICNDEVESGNLKRSDIYFTCLVYDMASCPGSSGARLFGKLSPLNFRDKYAFTHFGIEGYHGRTGLKNAYDFYPYRFPLDSHFFPMFSGNLF